jgi:hypothetical protein
MMHATPREARAVQGKLIATAIEEAPRALAGVDRNPIPFPTREYFDFSNVRAGRRRGVRLARRVSVERICLPFRWHAPMRAGAAGTWCWPLGFGTYRLVSAGRQLCYAAGSEHEERDRPVAHGSQ